MEGKSLGRPCPNGGVKSGEMHANVYLQAATKDLPEDATAKHV